MRKTSVRLAVTAAAVTAAVSALVSSPANAALDIRTATSTTSSSIPAFVLASASSSANPWICMTGHSQNVGWGAWDCSNDGNWAYAGTEGRGFHLEAVAIRLYGGTGSVCIGSKGLGQSWQGQQCVGPGGATAYTGTTGRNLPLELFSIKHTGKSTCANGHTRNVGWRSGPCVGANATRTAGIQGQILERVAATVLS